MRVLSCIVACTLVSVHTAAVAAQRGSPAPSVSSPPGQAAQFDFLVGQWSLVVSPAVSGLAARLHGAPRLSGTWKAWRALDGWGIEDELRITDHAGNPRAYTHAVRVYDASAQHWNGSSLDVYRGAFTSSTAEWKDAQMVVTSRGTDVDGRAYLARVRYYDISPATFRFQQDRSFDDGRSWTEAVLRIEARREPPTAPR